MNIFRLIFGLPAAALVTLGLFAFMAGVIQKTPPPHGKTRDALPPITFEPPPEVAITKTEVPQIPENAPPPTKTTWDEPTGEREFINFEGTPEPIDKTVGTISGSTLLFPEVKFAPQYPNACQSRGAEGSVVVEFDVTPEGNVINPRILSSDDRCFNRTVLQSVLHWKYPPDVSGGKPKLRRNVVERISFQLKE